MGHKLKARQLKKPRIKPTKLNVESTDLAAQGEVKLVRGKFPHTPTKLTRKGRTFTLAGVKTTQLAARALAEKEHLAGFRVGIAKTKDGFAVFIR